MNEFLVLMPSGNSNFKIMPNPLVSIVVPVYNAAQTLEKCVGSLILQTFGDIEILLINNGSTDNSLDVCNEIAGKESRIKVIDHHEKGVSTARNRGIEESSGDYVMFVDADAQYNKGMESVKTFLYAENVDVLSVLQKEELQIKVLSPQAPVLKYKVNTRFAGSACGKFYKREILKKNNLYFATETIISEDCLFNTLALDSFHRIGYTRDCFYYYEQHGDSAQNSYRPNSDKYFGFVIKQMQRWLIETHKDQRFVDAANCLFVHYLFGIMKEDIFHKDNDISLSQRCMALESLLSKKNHQAILQNANKDYFSILEKLLIFIMKKKFCWIITLLLWICL